MFWFLILLQIKFLDQVYFTSMKNHLMKNLSDFFLCMFFTILFMFVLYSYSYSFLLMSFCGEKMQHMVCWSSWKRMVLVFHLIQVSIGPHLYAKLYSNFKNANFFTRSALLLHRVLIKSQLVSFLAVFLLSAKKKGRKANGRPDTCKLSQN